MTAKDNITLPREVVEFVLKHLEWWSDDEPQEKEAIEALAALDAALAEPDAKREPATDEQITLKYRLGNYEDSFRDGWREAEWFHGITKEDK